MKNNIQFATLIRFIGVVLILLCHYTEQSSSSFLNGLTNNLVTF